MNITGNGTIVGDFIVNAPQATIYSDVNVYGVTYVDAVGEHSLYVYGRINNGIVVRGTGRIYTADHASSANITIESSEFVIITGKVNGQVIVRETNMNVVIDGFVQSLVLESESKVQISNQSQVYQVNVQPDVTATLEVKSGAIIPSKDLIPEPVDVKVYYLVRFGEVDEVHVEEGTTLNQLPVAKMNYCIVLLAGI